MSSCRLFFRTVFSFLGIILFSGCVNIDYVGQEYPERNHDAEIMFYNSKEDVPKDTYRIIGRANIDAPASYNPAEIKNKLLKKARDCGADAIEVVEFKREKTGVQKVVASNDEYNGVVGTWANNGVRSDGSPIYVDSFDTTVPLKQTYRDTFELKIKVLFLISNERFQEFQKKAAEEQQKDRARERMDRNIESKRPLDKRELEMIEATKSFQADL
ncbi:MAG: hypothetical protein WCI51_13990 [Lentisphaerota bacterium]